MKRFLLLAVALSTLIAADVAQAWPRGRGRGAVVVNAPGTSVVVGGRAGFNNQVIVRRGFRRSDVVVNSFGVPVANFAPAAFLPYGCGFQPFAVFSPFACH